MLLSTYLSQHKLNFTEFGGRIGVSQAAVSRYANGLRIPRPAHMRAIERETKGLVTANDFFAKPTSSEERAA